jgi:hypothetical protein
LYRPKKTGWFKFTPLMGKGGEKRTIKAYLNHHVKKEIR